MFSVNSFDELLVLHRTVMEAKFTECPRDIALVGSSYLANLSNNIVSSIITAHKKQGDKEEAKRWTEWRELSSHEHELKIIKTHILKLQSISSLSRDAKYEYILNLCAPFIPSDRDIERLLS